MSMNAWLAVRDYSIHKGSRLVLLWMIADNVMDDTNSCFCSLTTLANRSRLHRSEVQKYIPDLIATGDLIRVKRRGHTDVYYIPILEDEPGYAPVECDKNGHECNGKHTPLNVVRADLAPKRRRGKRGQFPEDDTTGDNFSTTEGGPKEWATPEMPAENEKQEAQRSGRGRPKGVGGGGPKEWATGVPKSGPEHLLNTYSNTRYNNSARAREDNQPLEDITVGTLALQRADPPPSPPPTPAPRPATGEKIALWRDICHLLPGYGVTPPQVDVMRTAHLYEPAPSVYTLYVPRGHDRVIFQSRYEGPIRRALEMLLHQGNQIVDFL